MAPIHPRVPHRGNPRTKDYAEPKQKCSDCGKQHLIRIPMLHEHYEQLMELAEQSKEQFSEMHLMVQHALDVYVTAALKGGNPDLFIAPPRRHVEVKWADLSGATKEDIMQLLNQHGIHYVKDWPKMALIGAVADSSVVTIIGKRGRGGMPPWLVKRQEEASRA